MKVQHWCAGWNRAGYSTESPEQVLHGGSLEDAFDYVQSQLEYELDYTSDEDEQTFIDAIDAWTHIDRREVEVQAGRSMRSGGASITVNGWEYWVQPCYTVGCDQVNTDE